MPVALKRASPKSSALWSAIPTSTCGRDNLRGRGGRQRARHRHDQSHSTLYASSTTTRLSPRRCGTNRARSPAASASAPPMISRVSPGPAAAVAPSKLRPSAPVSSVTGRSTSSAQPSTSTPTATRASAAGRGAARPRAPGQHQDQRREQQERPAVALQTAQLAAVGELRISVLDDLAAPARDVHGGDRAELRDHQQQSGRHTQRHHRQGERLQPASGPGSPATIVRRFAGGFPPLPAAPLRHAGAGGCSRRWSPLRHRTHPGKRRTQHWARRGPFFCSEPEERNKRSWHAKSH